MINKIMNFYKILLLIFISILFCKENLYSSPINISSLDVLHANKIPIYIQANKVKIFYPEKLIFSGDVYMKQKNNSLFANEIIINKDSNDNNKIIYIANAYGNVKYSNDFLQIEGTKGKFNFNNTDIDLYNIRYFFIGKQGRGHAENIIQRNLDHIITLKNGSLTSCPINDNSWTITGSKLIYDREKELAKIWNAYFKIIKLPILYTPYLSLPIGSKPCSGLLTPNLKYNSNGKFGLSVPYYIYFTKNYDSTFTINYMNQYGIQIESEFRYLIKNSGKGLIELDWLFNNKFFKNKHFQNMNNKLWLIHWQQNFNFNKFCHSNINYTKISDPKYLRTFFSKYGSFSDGYVPQNFSIDYNNKNWNIFLLCEKFQVFNKKIRNNYYVVPKLDFSFFDKEIGPFSFTIKNQIAKFININNLYPRTTRLHIEPIISLPLVYNSSNINTEIKFLLTHYNQNNIEIFNDINNVYHLKKYVNRGIAQFKTDSQTIVKTKIPYLQGYIQTIEPRIQYLYRSYSNQNSIDTYDSSIVNANCYLDLFNDNIYSGLDRISSSNKLTSGIITRIYNIENIEKFNLSLGQIYNFSYPRINNIYTYNTSSLLSSKISLLNEISWYINTYLSMYNILQYNSNIKNISLINTTLKLNLNKNNNLKLNHIRFNPKFFENKLSNNQQQISQLGFTNNWSLSNRWFLISKYYYDLKNKYTSSQSIGIKYNTCCWMANINYARRIKNPNNISIKYDNQIIINFSLCGLNSK